MRRRRRRRRAAGRMVRLGLAVAVCVVGVWALCRCVLPEIGVDLGEMGRETGEAAGWPGDENDGIVRKEEAGEAEDGKRRTGEAEAPTGERLTEESSVRVDLAQLYSPCAVLAEADSGRVLAEHNGQKRIYPASLTKLMTAVIVLEHVADLSETVTLSTEMFSLLYVRHASVAGFEPEETVCIKDLLYGILLPSGAECSIACAEKIAGSEEAFAELMNQKAWELGMEDTHFCNVTGLHEKEHFSTVCDMAVLLRYALQNDTLREILSCKSYVTEATGFHPEGLTFTSTLFDLLDTPDVPGGEILGGKTGYTKEAGLCLASFARIGGQEYLLVTAGADGSHQTKPFHVLDAQKVYGKLQ